MKQGTPGLGKGFSGYACCGVFHWAPHGGISTPASSRGSEKGCRGLKPKRGTPI